MVPYGHGYKHDTVQKYRNAFYTHSLHTEIFRQCGLETSPLTSPEIHAALIPTTVLDWYNNQSLILMLFSVFEWLHSIHQLQNHVMEPYVLVSNHVNFSICYFVKLLASKWANQMVFTAGLL